MADTIGVVIPVHPARMRNGMLDRALKSVNRQTHLPDEISVVVDQTGAGARATRARAIARIQSEWIATLDSDDEFGPYHLEALLDCARTTGADWVYSWYDLVGNADPLACFFGQPFDPVHPYQHPGACFLARTGLVQAASDLMPAAGTTLETIDPDEHTMLLAAISLGAKGAHLPRRTWTWNHHGLNTSGLPDRGDAR